MSSADVDIQKTQIEKVLNVKDLQDPEKVNKLVKRFTAMYDLDNDTSGASALAIFGGGRRHQCRYAVHPVTAAHGRAVSERAIAVRTGLPYRRSCSTLSGFMMPAGSKAALMRCIRSISIGARIAASSSRFN